MKIKNNFKYLSILFLISTILVVFSISEKPSNPFIKSVIAQELAANKGSIKKLTKDTWLEKIKELAEFNNTEKNKLIQELERAIKEKKPTDITIFKPVNQKLGSLKTFFANVENSDLESLKKSFEKVEPSDLDNIKASSKKIVETLDNMIKVISPLATKPINPNDKNNPQIIEIQKQVNPPNTSPDGQLGKDTKKAISSSLNEQQQILIQQLGTLETKINNLQIKPETNPKPESQEDTIDDLQSRIKELEKNNKRLIFFSLFSFFLFIILLLANSFLLIKAIARFLEHERDNKQEFEKIYNQINRLHLQANNLSNQSSVLGISNKKPETSQSHNSYQQLNEDILDANDDYSESSNPQIDSRHDRKTKRIVREHQEEESVNTVNTYPQTKLVQSYNEDRKSLARSGTKVAIVKNSYYQDRLGGNQAAILNESRKGDYFVIRENGFEYLFPGEKLKVNQHNLATVEKLFVCNRYESSRSGKFKLIEAAVVSRSSKTELVLQQPGKLQFL